MDLDYEPVIYRFFKKELQDNDIGVSCQGILLNQLMWYSRIPMYCLNSWHMVRVRVDIRILEKVLENRRIKKYSLIVSTSRMYSEQSLIEHGCLQSSQKLTREGFNFWDY
uniref:Uncharacterized protein n=1 Tax=Onchocerca volvulus TaxID=6282 RepID=A0A8R1XVK7_ONCVO